MCPGLLSILQGVKEVVVTIAALTTAGVAVYGLATWRRQLKGQTEFDLARRLLRAVYRVRDELRSVRHPFMSGAEMAAAAENANGDKTKSASTNMHTELQAAAYSKRWSLVQAAMSDLTVEILEAEVLWGKETVSIVAPLHKCVTELCVGLQVYFRYLRKPPANYDETMAKAEAVIMCLSHENVRDQYDQELDSAVDAIEAAIRPYLTISS